jgi:hypothetical protein
MFFSSMELQLALLMGVVKHQTPVNVKTDGGEVSVELLSVVMGQLMHAGKMEFVPLQGIAYARMGSMGRNVMQPAVARRIAQP